MIKTFRQNEEENFRHFVVPYEYVRHGTLNIDCIHPLKQKQVHELCLRIADDEIAHQHVEQMWIFGSSINNCCNIDSDLDILISLNPKYDDDIYCHINSVVSHAVRSGFDLLILQDLDPNKQFYNAIMRNRRLVYERIA